jgi:arylesterase/paraoxonase
MLKKILLGTLAGIVVICAAGALYLYSAVNKDIEEHFAGACTELDLPGSGEDIQLDRERGFAYLSVFDRMGVARGEPTERGQIMRLDLSDPSLSLTSALLSEPDHMHPHGLSLFIDNDGGRHLIMINHPEDRENGQDTIERFVEDVPGMYRHVETFSSPLITRPNDLVATGPRQFYVAQDTGQGTGLTVTDLIYFDGEEYAVVADDIESGGGINVSQDYATLYIAETSANALRVVKRNPADGTVETLQRIDLGSGPDNVNVAEDGTLLIGAHSNLVALVMHFIVGSDSPTQVLRIDAGANPPTVEEIYLNKGQEISAGSGADQFGNMLLIGSITDKKILVCELAD